MGLPYIPQSPNERGNPRLSSLNFMGSIDVSLEEQHRTGYAGFVGSVMLFTAFYAMAWASLDRTIDTRLTMAMSFILLGGFALSYGLGFRLSRKINIKSETESVMLGITFGLIILAVQVSLMSLGISFGTNQNVQFALLAPVAETMLFVIAPYHFFRYNFPREHWLTAVIPADIVFSAFHFFRYASHPDVILIWIILMIGNTLFVYIYHITKNATAPMIAHFIVNLASNTQPVLDFLVAYIPLFIGMFIVFALIFRFTGEK